MKSIMWDLSPQVLCFSIKTATLDQHSSQILKTRRTKTPAAVSMLKLVVAVVLVAAIYVAETGAYQVVKNPPGYGGKRHCV